MAQIWRRRLSVMLAVLATLGLTLLVFLYAQRREEEAVKRAFDERAQPLAEAVQANCQSHVEVLQSIRALFASVPSVGAEEFSAFVRRPLSRNRGIRGLSWNPRITAADRPRFEAEIGRSIYEVGTPSVPSPPKPEYVVVRYVEPAPDHRALGLDVSSEESRRAALTEARDSGRLAATSPIRLVSDGGEKLAVLLFAPVYPGRDVPLDLAVRRNAIRGYATGAFLLPDIVEAALRALPRDGLTVALFDRQDAAAQVLLYSDGHRPHREEEGALELRNRFLFGGRRWEIHVQATADFRDANGSWSAWLILVVGLLFAGLLGALLTVMTTRTVRVEELAARRSADARVSEARNRDILVHMLSGMITFDERSRIDSVNPAAERIFGYPEEELLGKNVALLLADAPHDGAHEFLRQAHRASLGRISELWGRRKNGDRFFAEAALFEFAAPEGRRFACNFQDISERREVDQLKSEFVSTVSHELRTPLTSIRGSLGLLAAGVLGTLPPQVDDIVHLAERNAVRLTALINDILDFERLDSGRLQMQLAEVEVRSLIEQAFETVRPMADEQRIGLAAAPTALRVQADAVRIVQVLVNLLSNAVKFSPAGSVVRLEAQDQGEGRVRISVADRGQGIPASYQQKVFERFVHVDSAATREKAGTGLGLAICRAIVEHHGGRIGVESELGVGSTFWFDLPAVAPAAI